MRLTVLGSAASYAGPGEACAGYLVESGSTRLLLDVGNGVVANLGGVVNPAEVDAVFVTHAHPDHFLDLYALQALLRYAPAGPAPALDVWGPTGLEALMGRLLSKRGQLELAEAFRFHDLVHGEDVHVGTVRVSPRAVTHTDGAFALRVQDADGALLCYTSDAAFDETLVAAVRGCDLLLAESTLPEPYRGRAPHMTASEAGTLATEAGARSLILTHVWPTNDRSSMERAASQTFAGPVRVAEEFAEYDVRALERPALDAETRSGG